jgi:phosphinothricin acetyltransferase
MIIRQMTGDDWPAVCAIYEDGIATGDATFEIQAPTWHDWDANHVAVARLVACNEATILGWAALSKVSARAVYAGVAEVSIYVRTSDRNAGVGMQLLSRLVAESEKHGFWTLQAGIFPENEASVRLHQRCGFRTVGRRIRIGQMGGIWRDVLLMERRSPIVGVDAGIA